MIDTLEEYIDLWLEIEDMYTEETGLEPEFDKIVEWCHRSEISPEDNTDYVDSDDLDDYECGSNCFPSYKNDPQW